MSRTRFIEHQGRQILFVNFAGADTEEIIGYIEEAESVISCQPPKSVFCLTDVSGANFSKAVMKRMKSYVAHNKPYIWRSAVVGVEGLISVMFQAVVTFSRRDDLVLKGSLEEAKAWLLSQPPPDGEPV